MMKKYHGFYFIVVLILFASTSCTRQEPVTFESLLEEMIDRDRLAKYPDPMYITRQFSSYDRASVDPGDKSWFANWDRSMFIREETNHGRNEYVMVDVDGPGAIVRWWMTFAGEGSGEGIIRVYFDHSEEPAIEGVAFDVLSRGQLVNEPLSCPVSPETELQWRGHNLYLPLPYGKHVKITYESDKIKDAGAKTGGESVYYNINYRSYNPDVEVETFTMQKLVDASDLIDHVNDKLQQRDQDAYMAELDVTHITLEGTIMPGEVFETNLQGSKAIREVRLQLDSEHPEQALRSTVIEIEFDGNTTVWCPAGDFFGTGYQVRTVDTWYSKVEDNGRMRAWWIMPFRSQASFRIHNLGDQPVRITDGALSVSDWKWDRRSMHFGATWLQYTNLYTGERKNNEGDGNPFDINYTHLRGEGVVVGDVLTMFNTSYAWWGEGDEKIYIDGEDFPSHFGTGTEDYYGYAWCRPEVFNEAFIAQPDGSGNFWPGYTVNLRYRSLDAMPFTSEIRFDMEMWHWVSTWINFAPATFFYLKPGGDILVDHDRAGATGPVALKREDIISPWIDGNSIEAENMIELERQGGSLSFQWSNQFGWSADQQVWWREVTPGDDLLLGFQSDFGDQKQLTVWLTAAPDYGRIELSVNDARPVSFNAYHADGVTVKPLDLGEHTIHEGLNTLRIKLTGLPPEKEKGMAGIDKLMFN